VAVAVAATEAGSSSESPSRATRPRPSSFSNSSSRRAFRACSAGFDVPDFLAAGPRDVLVRGSEELKAREALLQAEIITDGPQDARPLVSPIRLLAGILIALALGALVVWLISLVVS
jgi:hypothetical protein